MKKTHILVAALLLIGVPAFAAQKKAVKPAPQPASVVQSIGINGEYTVYDADDGIDFNIGGATVQYSRDIYTTKGGTVFTLRISGSYGTGSFEEEDVPVIRNNELTDKVTNVSMDVTSFSLMIGCDANYAVNERCRLFVGPRLGYKSVSFDVDENTKMKGDEDEWKATVYGITAGVRYDFKDSKLGCEAGFSHLWNAWDADDQDTTTSNTFYAGVYYSF